MRLNGRREWVAFCIGLAALVAWVVEAQPRGVHVAFLNFLLPAVAAGASAIFKNKQQSKAKQAQYDQEQRDLADKKQQFELYERPKLEQQARRSALKSTLASAIARAAGLEKALPGFFASGPSTIRGVTNPYEGVNLGKRPGGFSWGSLLGDVANVGAQTYGAVKREKDIGVAFPAGNEQEKARVRLGLPPSPTSAARRASPGTIPDYVPEYDGPDY
jgi:hypothetical protein